MLLVRSGEPAAGPARECGALRHDGRTRHDTRLTRFAQLPAAPPTGATSGATPCAIRVNCWRCSACDALAARVSDAAAAQFPLRVPRAFVARMRHGDPRDPLLRQVLPLDDEDRLVPGFGLDAVGDGAARTAHGVLQKYRGRALLVATGSCAIHCRYCFRRHFDYAADTAAAGGWRAGDRAHRRRPRRSRK